MSLILFHKVFKGTSSQHIQISIYVIINIIFKPKQLEITALRRADVSVYSEREIPAPQTGERLIGPTCLDAPQVKVRPGRSASPLPPYHCFKSPF